MQRRKYTGAENAVDSNNRPTVGHKRGEKLTEVFYASACKPER